MTSTAEVSVTKQKKGEGRFMGFIRKPQALGAKTPTDTIEALISLVKADTALPSRLMASVAEVKRSVDATVQMYKPEVLRDLVRETGTTGTQKRFAAVALHTARVQLKEYKEGLENNGRRYAEMRSQYDVALSSLKEEKAPMMVFLARHAPSDERVTSLGEHLKEYSEAMEKVKGEVDRLSALISTSKDSASKLEKDLEAAVRASAR